MICRIDGIAQSTNPMSATPKAFRSGSSKNHHRAFPMVVFRKLIHFCSTTLTGGCSKAIVEN